MQRRSNRVANLAHFLTKNAARWPQRPAIHWGDATWSWKDLDERVSAFANALAADFGIGKGDRVLVQAQNSNQMIEVMLAAFRLGAVWVPCNFRQAPGETAYASEKANAEILVCDSAFADQAAAVRAARPDMSGIVTIGESAFGTSYEDLIRRHMGRSVANAPVDHTDPCWLFFTSGSTGRPKAVVLTHGQIGFVAVNYMNDLLPGTSEQDASLVIAPLSHGAGLQLIAQLSCGAAHVLMPDGGFSPAEAFRLFEKYKVSNLFTVPTIVKRLVEDPSADRFDHSSLRHVIYAGAPMYREDQKLALQKLGPVLVQYYGLGEVTGNITVHRACDHSVEDGPAAKVGTCGTERTGIEVSIQDDDGTILPPHETGEVCVIGSAVCSGYLDDEDANAKSFRNGWFRTGDIGHMDEERFLYLTGRASDMYISGGSNVYPKEVEEVLLTHPAVSEVAIIGIPDPQWGEVGLAVCVPATGETADAAELSDFLSGKVSRYKMPARYLFIDEMPTSAYGKITKKLVRETLEAKGLL
ncbi:acyl-CoA synthetase [Roseibium denhamense]|uniref:Fatty-acyl-CoA synthase n=1 Tax=Roseibium denhamense TaxID=76305 RepID=A0ABY1PEZ3_9HYPH|nr:acyl-CoA synthetase [Roseibium denhamense]MTI06261.1 acyl-CoA synthetase [Roseibium denhamense]SMP32926.1 fatty-acyl-CoA synthase [Roseibium denhamense]